MKARGSHAEAVSTNMCDRDCQTILWGESGTVVFDADGECSSCICGEGCLAHNILGVASCVPAIAHVVLVCVGLVTSAGSLCHATYNLNQQIRCAGSQLGVTASSVEACRRQLHFITIVHAAMSIVYFMLVLVLPGKSLRWSVAVLGIALSTAAAGGILTFRLWLSTHDPRLVNESSLVAQMSAAMAHPIGRCLSIFASSGGGVAMSILAMANLPETGCQVAALAFNAPCLVSIIITVSAGTSLMRIIDDSIRAKQAPTARRQWAAGDGGCVMKLVAARRKIVQAMVFCVILAGMTSATLTFAAVSSYGAAMPLFLYVVPLNFGPLIWLPFNIQLHAGRNKAGLGGGGASPRNGVINSGQGFVSVTSRFGRVAKVLSNVVSPIEDN